MLIVHFFKGHTAISFISVIARSEVLLHVRNILDLTFVLAFDTKDYNCDKNETSTSTKAVEKKVVTLLLLRSNSAGVLESGRSLFLSLDFGYLLFFVCICADWN